MLLVLLSCGCGADPPALYAEAAAAAEPAEALDLLRRACEAGLSTPCDVLKDPALQRLRADPALRRRLRELLRRHAKEARVTLVAPDEPGDPLVLQGSLSGGNGEPVTGALVFLFHTDHEGRYAPEEDGPGRGAGNPRLFGFVRSDAEGRFTVRTIRPAPYTGLRNLRHVHFTVEAEGFRGMNSQFYLDEDPEPTERQVRDAKARSFPILHAARGEDGVYRCTLALKLRARSG